MLFNLFSLQTSSDGHFDENGWLSENDDNSGEDEGKSSGGEGSFSIEKVVSDHQNLT